MAKFAEDKNFTAVILGGDMNCYGVARTFYEAYGVKSIMAGKAPIFPTANSSLLDKYFEPDLMEDDKLIEVLTRIEADYPDKKKFLFGSVDDYVRHIIHNREAIRKISDNYVIPMIEEDLFDKLDDKDTFYEMCEQYGLPYPKTTIFDCTKDDPKTFELPFDYPIFIKPVSNVIYFEFEFEGKQKGYKIESKEGLVEIMGQIQGAGYPDKFVFQEYIEGDDDSMYIYSAYCDSHAKVRAVSGGHILMHDRTPEMIGNYNAITGARDDKLTDRLVAFLEKIHFVGICHFDIQYDAKRGDYVVYEINLRQGRSNYYVTASGMNYAKYLVDDYVYGKFNEAANDRTEYFVADKPFIVSNVSRRNLMKAVGKEKIEGIPADRTFWFQVAPYDRSLKNTVSMLRLERGIMKNFRKYNK